MISKISTNIIFKYGFQESPTQASDLSYKHSAPVNETRYLQRDFLQSHKKNNPSFGRIPKKNIFQLCDNLLEETKYILDSEKIEKILKLFNQECIKIREKIPPDMPENVARIFRNWSQELANICGAKITLEDDFSQYNIEELVSIIKEWTSCSKEAEKLVRISNKFKKPIFDYEIEKILEKYKDQEKFHATVSLKEIIQVLKENKFEDNITNSM